MTSTNTPAPLTHDAALRSFVRRTEINPERVATVATERREQWLEDGIIEQVPSNTAAPMFKLTPLGKRYIAVNRL